MGTAAHTQSPITFFKIMNSQRKCDCPKNYQNHLPICPFAIQYGMSGPTPLPPPWWLASGGHPPPYWQPQWYPQNPNWQPQYPPWPQYPQPPPNQDTTINPMLVDKQQQPQIKFPTQNRPNLSQNLPGPTQFRDPYTRRVQQNLPGPSQSQQDPSQNPTGSSQNRPTSSQNRPSLSQCQTNPSQTLPVPVPSQNRLNASLNLTGPGSSQNRSNSSQSPPAPSPNLPSSLQCQTDPSQTLQSGFTYTMQPVSSPSQNRPNTSQNQPGPSATRQLPSYNDMVLRRRSSPSRRSRRTQN